MEIYAYKREDGSYGIRNHVLVLPIDAVSYTVTRAVDSIIEGVTTFYHPYGKMQFGEDLEVHIRTLVGIGKNPNVAAVILVGCEPSFSKNIADLIAKSGKPVDYFSTVEYGDFKTIEMVSRKALEYVRYASRLRREKVNIGKLSFGLKCGESDTTSGLASNPALGKVAESLYEKGSTLLFGETPELTGAEDIIYSKIRDKNDKNKFLKFYREYIEMIKSKDSNLLGSQPNRGNIAGGISTIEEKALGNIQKIGDLKIDGVLDISEKPKESGLYFMNTSSAAADLITSMAAGGTVMNLFTTGRGNNIGNPIVPVVKITANSDTNIRSEENIDLDISGLIHEDIAILDVTNSILDYIASVSSGEATSSEILRHNEFAVARLFPQA